MDKATNKLITNFVMSIIINISKRDIARSKKRLNLAPTLKKIEKWHMQIDLEQQVHSKKVYTDMANEYWLSSNIQKNSMLHGIIDFKKSRKVEKLTNSPKTKEFTTKLRDCAKT